MTTGWPQSQWVCIFHSASRTENRSPSGESDGVDGDGNDSDGNDYDDCGGDYDDDGRDGDDNSSHLLNEDVLTHSAARDEEIKVQGAEAQWLGGGGCVLPAVIKRHLFSLRLSSSRIPGQNAGTYVTLSAHQGLIPRRLALTAVALVAWSL